MSNDAKLTAERIETLKVIGPGIEANVDDDEWQILCDMALRSLSEGGEQDEKIYTKADAEAMCQLAIAGYQKARRTVTEKMVSRFLSWELPRDFAPDCGIRFEYMGKEARDARGFSLAWPIGTNLLTAIQARQMLEHVLDTAPPQGEWVSVPREPTPEMCAAGFSVDESEHDPAGVYRAMLSAAPERNEG